MLDINSKIYGRMYLDPGEIEFISEISKSAKGTFVEIGTLYGGTTILIRHYLPPQFKCISIDPIKITAWKRDGFTKSVLSQLGFASAKELIRHNFSLFGFENTITQIKALSYPWPLSEPIDTVFIDGSHHFPDVLNDWRSCLTNNARIVIFHDYNHPYITDIKRVVDEYVLPQFKPFYQVDSLIAFQLR